MAEYESIYHLKRITAHVISNILYIRGFFDENSYYPESYQTIKIRILSQKSANASVQRIIFYLQGCFEAIEKRCLRSIVIGLYEKDGDELCKEPFESYQFNYSYKSSSSSNSITNASIHQHTSQVFKKLLLNLKKLKKLSKDKRYSLSFKLYYYDEVTYPSYEPKGFMPLIDTPPASSPDFDSIQLSNDKVETSFHSLDFEIKTKTENIVSSVLDNEEDSFDDDNIFLPVKRLKTFKNHR